MNPRLARPGFAPALLLAAFVTGLALVVAAPDGRAAAASASATAPSSPASAAVAASPPASVNGAVRAASAPVAPTAPPAPIAASAPATAAASSAAPTVANGTSTTAQTAPVRPAASQPSVPLPPRLTTCVATLADPDKCGPLTLERDPVTLPHAGLGRPYARVIRAEGGLPPYEFDLMQGNLPGGLTLDMYGRIVGTPDQPGSTRFRVRVVDAAGDIASQTYRLSVFAPSTKQPAKPPVKSASAAASAAAKPLTQVDLSQAGPPAHTVPAARVYQLEPAQLDALKTAIKTADAPAPAASASDPSIEQVEPEAVPEPAATAASAPTPPAPAGLVWSDAQHAQLEALLQPVIAIEYPTRSLFEAAIDAQVCAQAWQLIVSEAQRLKQQPPNQADFAALCPPPAQPALSATAKAPSPPAPAPSAPASMTQPVSWRDLPAWLMPPGLRPWLVEAAVRDRPLIPTKPVPWSAIPSCNCAAPRLSEPLYAVYPGWLVDGPQPQAMDFSLINRATLLALPLGNDAVTNQVASWNEAQTAFIRTARAYETRVDFGIHGADWKFLATEPATARDALIKQLTTQVPLRARELLDRPLPDLASRAKAWLPGFGQVQRMGDGFTVFFDQLPDATAEPLLAARFADFYPRFVKGLAQAMGENRERQYAINLVMTDRQIADRNSPFDVSKLFELLKAVEHPDMAEGRIVETDGDYQRNSNIELRFLVLLTEPTTQSKKKLRATIEASPGLYGGDRRIFLRSVVPLLMLPQASAEQYRDDLVYLQDNFGGAGFWPTPLIGQQFDAEQQKALRNTFGPPTGLGVNDALCGIVCPNRWLVRLAFELLLLLGAVCWVILQLNCDWRARYGRYALLGAIPPVLVGAALLQCDPALEALRQGNAQLVALILIPLIAALWALLKRKEEKP